MSARKAIVTGGSLLLGGALVAQAITLARSVILARMIGPEDFGIAATLMISVTLLNMITDISPGKLLVQAPDGDAQPLQDTIQLLQAVRGLGSALVLLLLAWPMARLFHIPQATWAFCVVALVPLLWGFAHADSGRLQRHMKFGPSVWIDIASQVGSLVVATGAAWWWRDYRAALYAILAQAVLATAISFAVAERRYRWAWDKAYSARLMHFGWPLLINGILLFGIFQGDRVIVGSRFGVRALGWYAVAYNLTSMATSLFARVGSSLLLPLLAKVQDSPQLFIERNRLTAQLLSMLGTLIGGGLLLLGGPIIVLLYGTGFSPAIAVVPWLAAAQGLWMIRTGPIIASLARSDSKSSMVANIYRAAFLIPALAAGFAGSPVWVAAAACAGEATALVACFVRLRRHHGVPVSIWLRPTTRTCALIAACALGRCLVPDSGRWRDSLGWDCAVLAGLCIASLLAFPAAWKELVRFRSGRAGIGASAPA